MPTRPPTHRPPRAKLPDSRPSKEARGYGRHWQAIRLDYLRRHPLCSETGCREAATQVDHRLALSKGGTNDESNLMGYCHSHHSAKTCREDGGLGRPKSRAAAAPGIAPAATRATGATDGPIGGRDASTGLQSDPQPMR